MVGNEEEVEMSANACRAGSMARKLTKQEIDRRIEGVLSEVASVCDEASRLDGDLCRPRWIAASDLVRRVRPFLGLN